jgi:hypothetical protein
LLRTSNTLAASRARVGVRARGRKRECFRLVQQRTTSWRAEVASRAD